jgi:FMN-dependent NADH-azoreductase
LVETRWRRANPQGTVISRDLAAIEIPAIDREWISANLTPRESRTQQQNDVLALSTELTRELLTAGEYVIGIPMHNWGPSSSFKLWVDQIVRFGETIAVTPSGMKGTLDQKRATFFLAAGRDFGRHSEDASRNYLEPWLRTLFGNLGVRNMRFVLVDGTAQLNYGKVDRTAFLAPHMEAMQSLLADGQSR